MRLRFFSLPISSTALPARLPALLQGLLPARSLECFSTIVLCAGVAALAAATAPALAAPTDLRLPAPDDGWTVYTRAQVWAANDAVPLKEYDEDLQIGYEPRGGRNAFLMRNRAEAGAVHDGWEIALEYRQEFTLKASRDSLDFYRLYQGKIRPEDGRAFQFDGKLRDWRAQGLHLAKTFALFKGEADSPLFKLTVAGYTSPHQRSKDISGNATYVSAGNYAVDATYGQSQDDLDFPFKRDLRQSGSGASVSVAAQWPLTPQLTANLAVNDLWSRMRWTNVPAIVQSVRSNVSSVDAEGYINFAPLLSGQNSQRDKTGKIGASGALNLAYRPDDRWTFSAGADHLEGVTIPAVSVSYGSRWGAATLGYETRFKSVALGYAAGPFTAQVMTDSLKLEKARAFGLNLGLRLTF